MILENEYPLRNAAADVKLKVLQRLYNRYGVAGLGERLSGVDLLKRSGETVFGYRFPSTSHIAALPFLNRMMRIDAGGRHTLRTAWNVYVKEVNDLAAIPLQEQIPQAYPDHPVLGRYDGALLFEGRLTDILSIPSMEATPNKKFVQARDAQHAEAVNRL